MRIETYSIVKLHKNKYDKNYLQECYDRKCIPETDTMPRLLVIGSYTDNAECKVRYPNGAIQRVDYQDITGKSIFTKDHPDYPKLIKDMYAAVIEFNKGTPLKAFLTDLFPQVAMDIEQRLEHRNQVYKPKELTVPLQLPKTVPTTALTELEVLQSIDTKLQTLIDLWGGKGL
jgi:hypothetical protein